MNTYTINLPINPTERRRAEVMNDAIEHMGTCPVCGGTDGTLHMVLESSCSCSWGLCHLHRLKWLLGERLFQTTAELSMEALEAMKYQDVEEVHRVADLAHVEALAWEDRDTLAVVIVPVDFNALHRIATKNGFYVSSTRYLGPSACSVVMRKVGTVKTNKN